MMQWTQRTNLCQLLRFVRNLASVASKRFLFEMLELGTPYYTSEQANQSQSFETRAQNPPRRPSDPTPNAQPMLRCQHKGFQPLLLPSVTAINFLELSIAPPDHLLPLPLAR